MLRPSRSWNVTTAAVLVVASWAGACSDGSRGVGSDRDATVDGGAAGRGKGDASGPAPASGGRTAAGGASGGIGGSGGTTGAAGTMGAGGGTSSDGGPNGTCAAPIFGRSGEFDTTGAGSEITPSCAGAGGTGPGLVFRFLAPSNGRLTARTQSAVDLALSFSTACDGSELACEDRYGGDERLTVPVETGRAVFLFVGGHGPSDAGPFSLETAFEAAVCGDGDLDGGEECDDHNRTPGDGCSDTCGLEACETPHALALGVKLDGVVSGPSSFSLPCVNRLSGPEAVHRFTAPAAGTYRFTLTPEPEVDLAIALAEVCPLDRAATCRDDAFAGGEEAMTVALAAGQSRYVVVEGWGVPDVGAYSLEVIQDD